MTEAGVMKEAEENFQKEINNVQREALVNPFSKILQKSENYFQIKRNYYANKKETMITVEEEISPMWKNLRYENYG